MLKMYKIKVPLTRLINIFDLVWKIVAHSRAEEANIVEHFTITDVKSIVVVENSRIVEDDCIVCYLSTETC